MPIRKIPDATPSFKSLETFLNISDIPQGTFSVMYNGVPIDFNYEDRGYGTTGVFFQAAVGMKVKSLPIFLGRSFSNEAKLNRLFVSDPSLYINDRIRLAWYAGSAEQPHLQSVLSQIFVKIAGGRRTLYFGASGGGFAALAFSAMHGNSLAIAVNPQTDIADYTPSAVARWTDLAWGLNNEDTGGLLMPETITDVRQLYADSLSNHVLYVQNIGDESHVVQHWEPFKEAVHVDNHIVPVLNYSGKGHVAPPANYLAELLSLAADTSSWERIDPTTITASPLRNETR